MKRGEKVSLIVVDADADLVLVTTSLWDTEEMWDLLVELAEHRIGIEARVFPGGECAKDRNASPVAVVWPSREWLKVRTND